MISVDGSRYRAHRLAWLYMTGEWSRGDIDHINTYKADNRFCNLREATRSQNSANSPKQCNNVSGFEGVSWVKRDRKWRSDIGVKRESATVSVISMISTDAMIARNFAALKHFGKFARLDPEFKLAVKQYRALRNLANYTLHGA